MPEQSKRPPFRRDENTERIHEQIAALVEKYSATLYRVAYSVVRNHAEAEDIVEDAFLRVLRHGARLDSIKDKRVWLVRIAWNIAIDRTRRAKARPDSEELDDYARVAPSPSMPADEMVIADEERSRILAFVDQLPAKERAAFTMYAVEDLNTTEIAAVLRTTTSTVRSRLFRARCLLKAMIEQNGCFPDLARNAA